MLLKIKTEIGNSFHQIYQCIFKPITFGKEISKYFDLLIWEKLPENDRDILTRFLRTDKFIVKTENGVYKHLKRIDRIRLLLKLSFFSIIISIVIDILIGTIFSYFGYAVDWNEMLLGIAGFIALGIVLGILDIVLGIVLGIAAGIASGIAGGIAGGIAVGISFGISFGIAGGAAMGIFLGLYFSIADIVKRKFFGDMGIGSVGGSIIVFLFIINYIGIEGGMVYGIVFLLFYFRAFYILPQIIQYFRVKVLQHDPFSLFKNSPIYWDEVILMPLPFLSDFLVLLTGVDRNEGLKEIEFISSNRPTQRKAATSALLEITIQDMNKFNSIKEIAQVSNNLSFLSAFKISEEFSNAVRNIENISIDAKSYFDSTSNYNKIRNLQILLNDIKKFQNILTATKGPTGYKFHSVADKWYQIIEDENKKFIEIKKDTFDEIPNPYIFGTPVRTDDSSNRKIFVKRDDIIREIESNLSNISQKPTLFLYGRRRVGKSSALINLPGSLGKQYIPVYIDCQDGRTTESIASFCYSISKSISDAFKDRGFYSRYQYLESANREFLEINCKEWKDEQKYFADANKRFLRKRISSENPSLESFQKSPFTILGNWFDSLEKLLDVEEKLILINLDEYEKLEESILRGTLPISILDQLRNIIQHRKYFVLLISGSRELSEMKLPWSDYLISAKTIKLGYLPEAATRTLIINPIDDFSLNYDGGANGAAVNRIIEVTNCQPYLVQALCFELVNYMNEHQRREAKLEDVDAAIEKVLASANVYFYYIWKEECSENEKELLLRLVRNLPLDGNEKEINSLVRKEIIEKMDGKYKFKVELMKKWIEKNEL